jgi:carbon-monoxide dehydrogenase medium subunit
MPSYAYHRPTTLSAALALKSATPNSRFIAGGTDLLVAMRKHKAPLPAALISLRNIDDLSEIEVGDRIRIGSTVPLSDVEHHPTIAQHFPTLIASIAVLGSRQIRNVATVGGNLCNASPAADTAPPLFVHDAVVELRSEEHQREVPIERFFQEPGKCAIEDGEVLTAIVLERPSASTDTRSLFLRKGRVKRDLAVVSVAVLMELKDGVCRKARIAAGAVAPTPLRLREVEAVLEGTRLADDILIEAQEAAMTSVSPITDLRSTEEYRRDLIGVYVRRAVEHLRVGDMKRD